MGQVSSQYQCCFEEHGLEELNSLHPLWSDEIRERYPWEYTDAADAADAADVVTTSASSTCVESLGYSPVQYESDEGVFDVERSSARYSRTRRKHIGNFHPDDIRRMPPVCAVWLHSCNTGRAVVVIGIDHADGSGPLILRTDCVLYASAPQKTCVFLPSSNEKMHSIKICIPRIQAICPWTTFVPFLDELEVRETLSESEAARAVVIQYISDAPTDVERTPEERKSTVCFLEESDDMKDNCIQALSLLALSGS